MFGQTMSRNVTRSSFINCPNKIAMYEYSSSQFLQWTEAHGLCKIENMSNYIQNCSPANYSDAKTLYFIGSETNETSEYSSNDPMFGRSNVKVHISCCTL